MTNVLNQYFPMIRSRQELLEEIGKRPDLKQTFESWSEEAREEFLDFCSGVRGVRILYDSFFREVMNPESAPERMEDFLGCLMKRSVKILQVLPNDSVRVADEGSLLVTDIVVELEDGSIANIEIQKVGYLFPGERAACYSADLLLRQYKRVRSHSKKVNVYRDVRDVYVIVLMEKSPKLFSRFPQTYLHHFAQRSDTGLELPLLQKYSFVSLDIFKKNRQNKPIRNKLDAWLWFFIMDEPEKIGELIAAYPEFKELYRQIYQICRNLEGVMGLFSEELRILDRNTTKYMMDEMQKEIDTQKQQLEQKNEELSQKEEQLSQKDEQLSQKDQQLSMQNKQISKQAQELSQRNKQLSQKDEQLSQKEKQLSQKDQQLSRQNEQISKQTQELSQKDQQLSQKDELLSQQERTIAELERKYQELLQEKTSQKSSSE